MFTETETLIAMRFGNTLLLLCIPLGALCAQGLHAVASLADQAVEMAASRVERVVGEFKQGCAQKTADLKHLCFLGQRFRC